MQNKLDKKSASARFMSRLMIVMIVLVIILSMIAIALVGALLGEEYKPVFKIAVKIIPVALGIALFTVMMKFRYRAIRYRVKSVTLYEIVRMLQKDGGEGRFLNKLERLENISAKFNYGASDPRSDDILLDVDSVPEARYQAYLWVARQFD